MENEQLSCPPLRNKRRRIASCAFSPCACLVWMPCLALPSLRRPSSPCFRLGSLRLRVLGSLTRRESPPSPWSMSLLLGLL